MAALIVFSSCTQIPKSGKRSMDTDYKPGELEEEGADLDHWEIGFYSPGFTYPYLKLKELGMKITSCSPKGGAVAADLESLGLWDHPKCNNCYLQPQVIELLANTQKPNELKGADYDIIHFVGGRGCFFDTATDPHIKRLAVECHENQGFLSSNSDGVAALLDAKLSNGKNLIEGVSLTGLTEVEQNRKTVGGDLPFILQTKLTEQGANFKRGIPVKDHVEFNNNIITGQNQNSSEPLGRCIGVQLKKVMKAKKSVLYIMSNVEELPDGQKIGLYPPAYVYPFRELKRQQCYQTIASPTGGAVHLDPWAMELWDHPVMNNILQDDHSAKQLQKNIPLAKIKPQDYKCVIFPGGYAQLWDLADNPDVERIVRHVYEHGGIIGCNSHGAVGLLNVKLSDGSYLVAGKNITCLPDFEEEVVSIKGNYIAEQFPFKLHHKLQEQGAVLQHGIKVKGKCVSEKDRIITGQNPNSAEYLGRRIAGAMKKL